MHDKNLKALDLTLIFFTFWCENRALLIPMNVVNVADTADVDKSYYFRSQNHCTTD